MRNGWMSGMAVGAMVGASAMAVFTSMNHGARRKMVSAVNDSARKMANKAENMMK